MPSNACGASQPLLNGGSSHSDVKLYFIDEATQSSTAAICATTSSPATSQAAKISTAKNLQLLLELHCAHDHWNFEDVATHYGLTLPIPRPECWACLLSKPKMIAHDKVSTRKASLVFEGFAADAKGPMNTPTPEATNTIF